MTDTFEEGSIAAANAIIGFLRSKGHGAAANDVLMAWNDGTITDPAPSGVSAEPTLLHQHVLTKEQARGSGYTGDQCTNCNSMRMQIAGHCLVCADCGTTTGCS